MSLQDYISLPKQTSRQNCIDNESHLSLDNPNVDVLFEQMRGEAVPQRVRRHAFGDYRRLRRGVTGAIELPGRLG